MARPLVQVPHACAHQVLCPSCMRDAEAASPGLLDAHAEVVVCVALKQRPVVLRLGPGPPPQHLCARHHLSAPALPDSLSGTREERWVPDTLNGCGRLHTLTLGQSPAEFFDVKIEFIGTGSLELVSGLAGQCSVANKCATSKQMCQTPWCLLMFQGSGEHRCSLAAGACACMGGLRGPEKGSWLRAVHPRPNFALPGTEACPHTCRGVCILLQESSFPLDGVGAGLLLRQLAQPQDCHSRQVPHRQQQQHLQPQPGQNVSVGGSGSACVAEEAAGLILPPHTSAV